MKKSAVSATLMKFQGNTDIGGVLMPIRAILKRMCAQPLHHRRMTVTGLLLEGYTANIRRLQARAQHSAVTRRLP